MHPEGIVSFFESRGHRVIQTASSWWYNEYRQDRIYNSFPIHRLVNPGPDEIKNIFKTVPRALALRFIGPTASRGQESFIWVCRRPYEMTKLSPNIRSHVRRGMKRCQVRSISFEELVLLGREAHDDTLQRHAENNSQSLGFDTELQKCSAFEAWGAFVEGRLAAYMVTLWVEDWVHILLHRSVTAYLKSYPNNALIFSVVSELLSRPGVTTVSFGLEPLVSHDSLAHFKSGMGFLKEPVCQRVVLAKRAKLLLNPITNKSVEVLANLLPGNSRLQKVAGICRIARKS